MDGHKELYQATVWSLDLSGSDQGAGGVGGLLFWSDSATDTSHFASSDVNGNVVSLASGASGTASASCEYGTFGKVLIKKG